ncbi:TetR family transcriptional regulator [Marinibaculum pumilum]|uniref:TetR family transcriptional regulator n=1 Tax=Marinibaculum pumilum TaxID=1766165 RepID=A0ABV7L9T4_9PROT
MAVQGRRRNAADGKSREIAAHAVPGAAAQPAVSEELLMQAAIKAFVEKGFHGTSMRDIAARAGTSVSHSYYYFPSKQQLLWQIVSRITQELQESLGKADREAGPDPAARLAAIVRAHVLLHTQRQDESFIGNSELRSLRAEDRPKFIEMRDRVSAIFKGVINDGIEQGVFTCPEPVEVTLAVITMCTAIAGWYRPDGPVSPQVMANRYAAIALRMAGYRGAA